MESLSPPDNYILRITVLETEFPTVSRIVSVPADVSFHHLHGIIQTAFNWTSVRGYTFEVLDQPHKDGNYRTVHLVLSPDASVVHVPQQPPPYAKMAHKVLLKTVFESERALGKCVEYEYRNWRHSIELLSKPTPAPVADPAVVDKGKKKAEPKVALCLGGEGHYVAEGETIGPKEWQQLKVAYSFEDEATKEEEELMDWYEQFCENGEAKGLRAWRWNIADVNQKLAILMQR